MTPNVAMEVEVEWQRTVLEEADKSQMGEFEVLIHDGDRPLTVGSMTNHPLMRGRRCITSSG